MSPAKPMLSSEAWNPVIESIIEDALGMADWLMREVYATGGPPGTYPRPPIDQYRMLVQMRAAGDSRFWDDAHAQTALEQLSKRFGPPPPVPVPAEAPLLPQLSPPQPGLLGAY